jgi:GT2 family glycosyltransferase
MSGNSHTALVAVVICSYGHDEMTQQVVSDLRQAPTSHITCVVDNSGTYEPRDATDEVLLRPNRNLGWAAGSNYGLRAMLEKTEATAFVVLNNDVRLSVGFLDGLHSAWLRYGGIVGPVYDHNWDHQRLRCAVAADKYRSRPVERKVPFVDGTCMMLGRDTLEAVGLLDTVHWSEWGWGCDKDLCLRARHAGRAVWATERAYLTHAARSTAGSMPGFSETAAEAENDAGMSAKWGPEWEDRLFAGFDHLSRDGLVQRQVRDKLDEGGNRRQ